MVRDVIQSQMHTSSLIIVANFAIRIDRSCSQILKKIGFAIILDIVQHLLNGIRNKLGDIIIKSIKQIDNAHTNEQYLSNTEPRVNLIILFTVHYHGYCILLGLGVQGQCTISSLGYFGQVELGLGDCEIVHPDLGKVSRVVIVELVVGGREKDQSLAGIIGCITGLYMLYYQLVYLT